jgi:hypothetical protein
VTDGRLRHHRADQVIRRDVRPDCRN